MDKKIIDLGNRTGRLLLFGGVYSNLQALESLMHIAERQNIPLENCFCTGDIVGYCAQPEETVSLFRDWGAQSILGNVEEQLASKAVDCGCDFSAGSRCDNFAKEWYPYAQSKLSSVSIEWMQNLPHHITFTYAHKRISLVHGSFHNISAFIFKSSPWATKHPNFKALQSDVIVAGHCGLPFNDSSNNQLWLNPGVIGMPANDGQPKVWYALVDDLNGLSFKHQMLTYDHHKASELLLVNGLPPAYAKTLLTGLWDNMEILPAKEKQQQGKVIGF